MHFILKLQKSLYPAFKALYKFTLLNYLLHVDLAFQISIFYAIHVGVLEKWMF